MFGYNLIRFGGQYLTSDGLVGGDRYITEVSGLDSLKFTGSRGLTIAIGGEPYTQTQPGNKGFPVSIRFELIDVAMFDTLVGTIQSSIDAGTSIALYISGSAGVFNLSVVPAQNVLVFPATALDAGLKDVTLNFVVSAAYRTLSASAGVYNLTGIAVTFSP